MSVSEFWQHKSDVTLEYTHGSHWEIRLLPPPNPLFLPTSSTQQRRQSWIQGLNCLWDLRRSAECGCNHFRPAFRPGPCWGAHDAPPDTLVGWGEK